jgi:hypothetical protein
VTKATATRLIIAALVLRRAKQARTMYRFVRLLGHVLCGNRPRRVERSLQDEVDEALRDASRSWALVVPKLSAAASTIGAFEAMTPASQRAELQRLGPMDLRRVGQALRLFRIATTSSVRTESVKAEVRAARIGELTSRMLAHAAAGAPDADGVEERMYASEVGMARLQETRGLFSDDNVTSEDMIAEILGERVPVGDDVGAAADLPAGDFVDLANSDHDREDAPLLDRAG